MKSKRPPIVAIMGHVDHGKSTLLDFIRSTNVVAGESGGITQHLSAYEVVHPHEGEDKRITFIDTPGHAAFSGMRTRGASVADIAILIISAVEGVQEQTVEAIRMIREHGVPFVVAINKIDQSGANPEKVKMGLMEHSVFLEGYGGDVPCAEISSKTGVGVPELLDILLLVAEIEDITGDHDVLASGFVIESHLDKNRGNTAILIIKNGTLSKGDFIVAGTSIAGTRIVEDFQGKPLTQATFSSPICISGFDTIPTTGAFCQAYSSKKEAETAAREATLIATDSTEARTSVIAGEERAIVPIIIKTDVLGTKEALESEINKTSDEHVLFKIVRSEVGSVNSSDIQLAGTDAQSIILAFRAPIDREARETLGSEDVLIKEFNVIYKLIEWLQEECVTRKPLKKTDEIIGTLKILKVFSESSKETTLGGAVVSGEIAVGGHFRIIRKGEEVAKGVIRNIQQAKTDKTSIHEGEAGLAVTINHSPFAGDTLETFKTVIK